MVTSVLASFKGKLGLFVIGILLSLVLALSPTTTASAFTDGLSWVNCNGRFSMGTVNLGNVGTVTAYGCSNGYFFVTTASYSRANLVASITRVKKSPNLQLISQSQVFKVSTNMSARINGACYDVWGSVYGVYGGTGKGWRFCW